MMNDLISRQAAIDALTRTMVSIPTAAGKDLMADVNNIRAEDIAIIKRLPSAQPETHDKRTESHACDLISRQALCEYALNQKDKNITANDIMRFPSAQPKSYREGYHAGYKDAQSERQKGEWIDYTEDGYVECPFCHNATNCDGNKDELHFCFSCGADMRGELE